MKLRLAMLVFAIACACLAGWIASQAAHGGIAAADRRLQMAAPWLMALRFAAASIAIAGWPRWIAFLARQHGWPQPFQERMAGLRWRLAAWMALIELALVQGGYKNLVQLIAS